MKKTLNTTAVRNELEGASLFFAQRTPPPASTSPTEATVAEPNRSPERPNDATTVRPNAKRIITRNSFEIYEDQMDSLRELAYDEKRQGRVGSMSAMVRAAIDAFLERANSSK